MENVNDLIKVIIADDHTLFRTGIIRMLSNYPDISIIDEADNGETLYQKYFEYKPDVILVDISMPILSGLEAVKKIRIKDDTAKALFLSMYDSPDYVYSCFISGGMGLINKDILEGELVYAIRCVFAGKKYFGKNFNEEKLNKLLTKYESIYILDLDTQSPNFTKRESEILKMIGKGYSSAVIAEKLFISIRTVDSHRTHLMHKLNFNSTSELVNFAVQYQLKDGFN